MNKAMTDAKSGKMTMTVVPAAGSGAPTGSMQVLSEFVTNASGQMDMKMSMTIAGQGIEALLVGGVMYMKMPVAAKPGKPWVKIDSNGTSETARKLKATLEQADPRGAAKSYEGSSATLVSSAGGVSHYKITGVTGTAAEPHLWIEDATGRPQKMTMSLADGNAEISFGDWGAAITVAAPPASQVTTMP